MINKLTIMLVFHQSKHCTKSH